MTCAVTLCLDAPSARRIETLWRALADLGIADDRLRLGYRPHVTLALYDTLDHAAVMPVIARLAAGRAAMEVGFSGLDTFPGASATLWAAPVADSALQDLHGALHETLEIQGDPLTRPGAWVPHCTLAGGLSGPALEAALAALSTIWQPFTGRFDRLHLVRFPPVDILLEAPLGA